MREIEVKEGSILEINQIKENLVKFNKNHVSSKSSLGSVNLVIRNDKGILVGGISSSKLIYHFEINLLWVHSKCRGFGYGKKLLQKAIEIARNEGYKTVVLTTFSFQSPEFYKRNGFEVIGTLENVPPGHKLYYLRKDI